MSTEEIKALGKKFLYIGVIATVFHIVGLDATIGSLVSQSVGQFLPTPLTDSLAFGVVVGSICCVESFLLN